MAAKEKPQRPGTGRTPRSHGSGKFARSALAAIGANVVIEEGVLIFHPENVALGSNVYVGHRTMLKGYYKNQMVIGDGTWIGQNCLFHSAGGLTIGRHVGIGPCVNIITSAHDDVGTSVPILHSPIRFAPVIIEDDVDVGIGSIILPGVRIGRGTQIGAGAVVTRDIPPFSIARGVPARVTRPREEASARAATRRRASLST
jgi:acetyltransferase-like isoleucine patch superfamily enzyme